MNKKLRPGQIALRDGWPMIAPHEHRPDRLAAIGKMTFGKWRLYVLDRDGQVLDGY